MAQEKLKIVQKGPVLHIQLSREDVHNAFDADLIRELTEAFEGVGVSKETRVVVLSGKGKNFCAGADINWMKNTMDFSEAENEKDAFNLHKMLETIYHCPKPTIAAAKGVAFGGGVGLIACVDVAICATSSIFSLSEVRLGILPAVISPFVIRKIGVSGLRAFGLSAKRLSAEEALRINLVQEVVSEQELDQVVLRWVDEFLQNGPQAMAMLKELSEYVFSASLEKAAEKTVKTIAKARVTKEGQEGLRAFLEKRTPSFRVQK